VNVNEAVSVAKKHVSDLFAEERVTNLGLEEVEFNDSEQAWLITLGFSRPWDEPKNTIAAITQQVAYPRRVFKLVRVKDATGEVLSVKRREVAA
jgi:hypothetical protein